MFKKNIPYILLLISILITTLLWDKILIPSNESHVYGSYKENNYHPINEVLRFIFYISFPLIIFLISFYSINKKNCYLIKEIFLFKDFVTVKKSNKLIYFILWSLLFLIVLEFISINFIELHKNLDNFHDGVYLSASNNYFLKGGLWSSSFVEYGLINFDSILMWSIFNTKTIGSAKLLKYIYLLFNKIFLVYIIYEISKNFFKKNNYQSTFFLFISLFAISLVDYADFESSEFPSRLFIMLLFQLFFLKILISGKKDAYKSFILGFVSAFSILWSLDMGIFVNFLLILILIFFIIKKDIKKLKFITLGASFGWVSLGYIIGYNEILYLFETFYFMFTNNEQAAGLIYPTPFLSGEARFTKALLMYILSGVLLILLCLKKDIKISNSLKIFLISFFISSILIFKQALSRSDAAHIKSSSGITYVILFVIIMFFIFNYIENNKFFLKFINKITKNFSFKKIIYFLIIFCSFFYFEINLKNILTFHKNVKTYLNLENENFMSKESVNLVNYYKSISKNDSCIQTVTNLAALPYLMNKPSCTRYITNWYLITKKHQDSFIKELEKKKPRLILLSSKTDLYNFDDAKRIPFVLNYLKNNYNTFDKSDEWHFLKIK